MVPEKSKQKSKTIRNEFYISIGEMNPWHLIFARKDQIWDILFLYSNLKACNSTTFQFTLFLLECKYYFRHLIIFKPMLFDSSGCFNSFLLLNWQSKILYLYKYDYFSICVILYREFVFSILCWNSSMKCLIKENQTSIN